MLNVRPATLSDFNAILKISLEQCARYEHMRADRDRLKETITTSISAKAHCALVATVDDKVVGALIGLTSGSIWAQKQNCGIVLWASKRPILMRTLLKEFKMWLKPRRAIRVAGMSPDLDCDPKVWSIAQRIGFVKEGGSYLLYN